MDGWMVVHSYIHRIDLHFGALVRKVLLLGRHMHTWMKAWMIQVPPSVAYMARAASVHVIVFGEGLDSQEGGCASSMLAFSLTVECGLHTSFPWFFLILI